MELIVNLTHGTATYLINSLFCSINPVTERLLNKYPLIFIIGDSDVVYTMLAFNILCYYAIIVTYTF